MSCVIWTVCHRAVLPSSGKCEVRAQGTRFRSTSVFVFVFLYVLMDFLVCLHRVRPGVHEWRGGVRDKQAHFECGRLACLPAVCAVWLFVCLVGYFGGSASGLGFNASTPLVCVA